MFTKCSLMSCWYLNMTSCLLSGDVLDQAGKAALALATARSISAWVDCGTRVTTSLVAGLATSTQRSAVESTNLPSMKSCVRGGTRFTFRLSWREDTDVDASADSAREASSVGCNKSATCPLRLI